MIATPSLRSAIAGSVMLHSHSGLWRLVWMTLSKASSVVFNSGPKVGLAAALQTTMSMRDHLASVASTSPCSSVLLPTLQACARALPPAAVISAAAASQLSSLRLEMTTRAPWAAICTAIALPMPRLEPVMRATLSVRSNMLMGALLLQTVPILPRSRQ